MRNPAEEFRLCDIMRCLSEGADVGIVGDFSEAGRLRLNASGLNAVIFNNWRLLDEAASRNVVLYGISGVTLRNEWLSIAEALRGAHTVSIVLEQDTSATETKHFLYEKLTGLGFATNPRLFDHVSYTPRYGECEILLMTRVGEQIGTASRYASWRGREAAIFRTHFTGIFVRPGDRVVQIGSPSEYPLQKVARHGQFTCAEGVEFLDGAPGSADFIAVSDALTATSLEELVLKAGRMLTPGGRLAISVTHVESSAPRLADVVNAVSVGFKVEKIFTQGERERYFHDVTSEGDVFGDHCLVIASTDPLSNGKDVPFVDTIYPFPNTTSNLLAFERDYDNPWLMRTFFGMSVRTENRLERLEMARRIEDESSQSSADYGAAICVQGHDVATNGNRQEQEAFLAQARTYLEVEPASPHAFRWNVSVSFLCGIIHQGLGDFENALCMFDKVLESPWDAFSPTLGTKAADAAYRGGTISFLRGNDGIARDYWRRGVQVGSTILACQESELIGDPECPLPDPLAEITAALETVRKCADCLRVTDNRYGRTAEARRREMFVNDRKHELEIRLTTALASEAALRKELERANGRIDELEKQASASLWHRIMGRLRINWRSP